MRSHYDIIREAGPDALAAGLDVSVNTVRAWMQRSSIPSDRWKRLVELSVTSLEELAEHTPKPQPAQDAA